jgi:hypothetical protein
MFYSILFNVSGFELKSFNKSRDRFLIIDGHEVYYLRASPKDLGKRWFAFTQLASSTETELLKIMDVL